MIHEGIKFLPLVKKTYLSTLAARSLDKIAQEVEALGRGITESKTLHVRRSQLQAHPKADLGAPAC